MNGKHIYIALCGTADHVWLERSWSTRTWQSYSEDSARDFVCSVDTDNGGGKREIMTTRMILSGSCVPRCWANDLMDALWRTSDIVRWCLLVAILNFLNTDVLPRWEGWGKDSETFYSHGDTILITHYQLWLKWSTQRLTGLLAPNPHASVCLSVCKKLVAPRHPWRVMWVQWRRRERWHILFTVKTKTPSTK